MSLGSGFVVSLHNESPVERLSELHPQTPLTSLADTHEAMYRNVLQYTNPVTGPTRQLDSLILNISTYFTK